MQEILGTSYFVLTAARGRWGRLRGPHVVSRKARSAQTFTTTPDKKLDISTTASGIEVDSSKHEQPDVGLEPTTLRLRVSRATDCASRAGAV